MAATISNAFLLNGTFNGRSRGFTSSASEVPVFLGATAGVPIATDSVPAQRCAQSGTLAEVWILLMLILNELESHSIAPCEELHNLSRLYHTCPALSFSRS